jgi:hypothetical protein
MAKVKATVKCFIDNTIREENEVFEYNGPEIEILTPIDSGMDDDDQDMVEPERKKPGRPRKSAAASGNGMD